MSHLYTLTFSGESEIRNPVLIIKQATAKGARNNSWKSRQHLVIQPAIANGTLVLLLILKCFPVSATHCGSSFRFRYNKNKLK